MRYRSDSAGLPLGGGALSVRAPRCSQGYHGHLPFKTNRGSFSHELLEEAVPKVACVVA
jgi:hypothetical protein